MACSAVTSPPFRAKPIASISACCNRARREAQRISALSGWVWLDDRDAWGQFSIASRGLTKDAAVRIEDAIVHTVSKNAG